MKLFMWDHVEYATAFYHHEGAVMVVAADLPAARVLIAHRTEGFNQPDEPCEALTTDPDRLYDVGDVCEAIYVYPDKGCC